ncbi:heme lyase NrfEFG subunit NrfE, partial [Yersinia enterocolitica]|nr:heme lyase NrfEFG subunit NrfE [Yersinia enterocolitica]
MMPEIGSFLLCLALAISLLLSLYPQWGAARQDARMMATGRPLTYGMFATIALSFICLVYAFVVNDFTV